MIPHRLSAFLFALASLPGPAAAAPPTPEAVFKKASPSIVHLRSVDSEGSGVLIHKSGYILTALHVVAAGTPVEVRFPSVGGPTRVVKGASLYRVDPMRDLAVLKVDLGGEVPPLAVISNKEKPLPGAVCYALSIPAAAGDEVSHTFTQGNVSNAARQIDGQPFVQFSAPINPGSSGGALLDAAGEVTGVIVSKLEQAEGMGFAIPLEGLDLRKFVEATERTGDGGIYDEAMKMYARANTASVLSMIARPGGEMSDALLAANYFARLALTERPADEAALRAVIETHYLAGQNDACLEIAVAGAKRYGLSSLRMIEARSLSQLGRTAEARATYLELLMSGDESTRAQAAGALAEMLAADKESEPDWLGLAYYARWGLASTKQDATARRMSEIFEQASAQLEPAVVRGLATRRSGFSCDDLEKLRREPPAAEADAMLAAFDPKAVLAAMAGSSEPLGIPDALDPAEAPDDLDHYFELPDPTDLLIPASAGRLGLLVSEQGGKVRLFSLAAANVIGTRPFNNGELSKHLVMAGRDHWCLVNRERIEIIRYPLLGGGAPERIELAGARPWQAFAAFMSPYRDDLAWFLHGTHEAGIEAALYHFPSGQVRTPDHAKLVHGAMRHLDSFAKRGFFCDPSGRFFGVRNGGGQFFGLDPNLFALHSVDSRATMRQRDFHLLPGSDPAVAVMDSRSFHRWDGEKFEQQWDEGGDGQLGTPMAMAPVHGSPWVIQILAGARLNVRVLDPTDGRDRLPVQQLHYEVPATAGEFHMSGKPRFSILSHISTPRVAILDHQTDQLISARLDYWDWLRSRSSPLVIHRKPGDTRRIPFKVPADAKLDFSPHPDIGFDIDVEKGELVIEGTAKPPYDQRYAPRVGMTSKEGLDTWFNFLILGPESPE